MKTKAFLLHCLAVSVALATADAAEKAKQAGVADYPFYHTKKRGDVAQFVPGLNAALQLTPAQQAQIAAAHEEMLNDDAVKAARSLPKSDPNVTDRQREQARAALEAATARMREKVAAILTSGQQALIEKINATHAAAAEEAAILYESYFSQVKDEDERRRLHAEQAEDVARLFLRRLDGILTAEQKTAMTRAAEEENRRLAAATKVKTPAK